MFRTEIYFYKHEVLNQSHTTPVLISLFTATCFGTDYDPSSGLLYMLIQKKLHAAIGKRYILLY
jgi:hypothetical protein